MLRVRFYVYNNIKLKAEQEQKKEGKKDCE
jgi:hypothetical protein